MFYCNGMGILNIDLNNNNFGHTNYDKDDPDTIIFIRLLAQHINILNLKNARHLKKNKMKN